MVVEEMYSNPITVVAVELVAIVLRGTLKQVEVEHRAKLV